VRLVNFALAGRNQDVALYLLAVRKGANPPDGTTWRERGRPALKGVANPPRTWRLVPAPAKKATAARGR